MKGKIGYMAPEQLGQKAVRATDIYGAGVVPLGGAHRRTRVRRRQRVGDPRQGDGRDDCPAEQARSGDLAELDCLVLRALDCDPTRRFASGDEMAAALEAIVAPATPAEVGAFVGRAAEAKLTERAARIANLVAERDASVARAAADPATDAPSMMQAAPRAVAPRRGLPLFVAAFGAIAVLGIWIGTRTGAPSSR